MNANHLILGTAGHIDHGKTALVKALTGIDTDTLAEEKERGISINLGFAWLDLPGIPRIGVVDVPGHMRFIRTMMAGAAGLDLALLVVAADDSVMPQTREHFDILRLLGIQRGLIALNKADLVTDEVAEMAEEEVRELVRGSFLEKAPIVRVSAMTGHGLDELKTAISAVSRGIPERPDAGIFRMPVDRSFSVAGFGTVVTGTVFSGRVRPQEKVVILPKGLECEIRGIQVHKNKADVAVRGQRAALNLQGVDRDQAVKGDTICAPGLFTPTFMADCSLELLSGAGAIKQGERVKFYVGTTESDARLYCLDGEKLYQARFSTAVVGVRGDRFIIRDPGLTRTLGGGEILDLHPQKHKRKKNLDLPQIRKLAETAPQARLQAELAKAKGALSVPELCARLTMNPDVVMAALKTLAQSGAAVMLDAGRESAAMARGRYEALVLFLKTETQAYHAAHHMLATGVSKAEIRQKCRAFLGESLSDGLFQKLWERLTDRKAFFDEASTLCVAGWKVQLGAGDNELQETLYRKIDSGGFAPPDAAGKTGILEALVKSGRLVSIEGMVFSDRTIEEGKRLLTGYLRQKGASTVADLKVVLKTSRKFAIPLLNYYESKRLLVRRGDLRVLA